MTEEQKLIQETAYKFVFNEIDPIASEVEPIIDKGSRQEIIRFLKEKEIVQQVQFS